MNEQAARNASTFDWRFPLILIWCLTLLGLFFSEPLFGIPKEKAWWGFGVSAMYPQFADLRGVLSSAECDLKGISPYENNPCDHWHRKYNYPRIWLLTARIGLTEADTYVVGTIAALMVAILIFLTLGRLNFRRFALSLPLVLSPPVLLLVERGNCDIAPFFLIVLGLVFVNLRTPTAVLGYLMVFLAACLKLFPSFSFVLVFRERGWRKIFWAGMLGISFVVYLVLTKNDLRLILQNSIPDWFLYSFGGTVYFAELQKQFPTAPSLPWTFQAISFFLAGGLFVAFVALRLVISAEESPKISARNLDFLRVGAALYCCSFLFMANWIYRLSLLLLVIPALFEFLERPAQRRIGYAGFYLVSLTLFGAILGQYGNLLWILGAQWMLFTLLLGLGIHTRNDPA